MRAACALGDAEQVDATAFRLCDAGIVCSLFKLALSIRILAPVSHDEGFLSTCSTCTPLNS